MLNKDNFYGQVAVRANEKWYGRKLIKKNFHPYSKCVKIADDLAKRQMAEVHVTIFFSKNPLDTNADVIGDFLIDLDGEGDSKDNLEDVREEARFICTWLASKEIPFRIAFTSHRGFKIYVPFEAFGIEPTPVLPLIYKQFAEFIGFTVDAKFVDSQIYQLRHMNRWDNTIHAKTGLFQVPISFEELMREMDTAFLLSIAMAQRFDVESTEFPLPSPFLKSISGKIKASLEEKERKMRENQKQMKKEITKSLSDNEIKGKMRPCVLGAYSHGANTGKRNQTAFIILTEMRHMGIPKVEARERIKQWNTLNDSPLPEREIEATANSAYKTGNTYSYGCNNEVLMENCPFPDRKVCSFYRQFAHIKDEVQQADKLPVSKNVENKEVKKEKKAENGKVRL